jgi:hypothetical protein
MLYLYMLQGISMHGHGNLILKICIVVFIWKKERVGHSFRSKIEFGAIYLFLERTDAIIHLHILYLNIFIASFLYNEVSLEKNMFLYIQVFENFARQAYFWF